MLKKTLIFTSLFSLNIQAENYIVHLNKKIYDQYIVYTEQNNNNENNIEGSPSINENSCKNIRDSGKSEGDGIYNVNISNVNYDIYCDMTTDGGGWTLILGWDGVSNPINSFNQNTPPTLTSAGYFFNSNMDYNNFRITANHSNSNNFISRIFSQGYAVSQIDDILNYNSWYRDGQTDFSANSYVGENNNCQSRRDFILLDSNSGYHITILDHQSGTNLASLMVGPQRNIFCDLNLPVLNYGDSGQYVRYWIR